MTRTVGENGVREKVLRMFDQGFTTREIHESCAYAWPERAIGLNEVRIIIRDRVGGPDAI